MVEMPPAAFGRRARSSVAARVLYRHDIAYTTTPFEVAAAIEAFRDHTPLRPSRAIRV